MNYVNPFRSDKETTYEDVAYTMSYYREPTSLVGVTDEAYDEYDPATTYGVGDFCIIDDLKGIYRSSDVDNIGNFPPATETKWTFWSPINSYRMLAVDEFIGSQTTGDDIVMEYNFSNSSAWALVDVSFDLLLIEQIDNSTGGVVWSETISGSSYGASDYYEYFYKEMEDVTRIYRDGLVWLSDSTLRFTFTNGTAIGAIVMGLTTELGCTLYGTGLRFEDTSTISKSDVTGFRTVKRYGNVRVLNVSVLFDTINFNNIARKIEGIIGRNVLFIPTENDSFSEMITIGYFEAFDIPVEDEGKIETQSTIVGVI